MLQPSKSRVFIQVRWFFVRNCFRITKVTRPRFCHTNINAVKEVERSRPHIPVMAKRAIEILEPHNDQLFIDMTFGAGGHTREIMKHAPQCRVIALDRDPLAYQMAEEMASEYSQGQITPLLGRFTDLPALLTTIGVSPETVDGVLMDAGVSSMQFDQSQRGFSISADGPLDMRMDGNRLPDAPTAANAVNHLEEHDLCHIIKKYGEERRAKAIARAIIEARLTFGNITRTRQLADIVAGAVFETRGYDKLYRKAHVATRTFQALRIFVNDELNELSNALEIVRRALRINGRCVVLTFHSLEDRIVKRHFHGIELEADKNATLADKFRHANKIHSLSEVERLTERAWEPISRKVETVSYAESLKHPRARSAKLRGAVKVR